MMLMILVFILGYAAIAFEHPLKVDKTVPALATGVLLWTIISLMHLDVVGHDGLVSAAHVSADGTSFIDHVLGILKHHIGSIAEILVFLIGAMTIVELVDLHRGFSVITNRIQTNEKKKMLLIVGVLAFFLSSVLDNLTTTIVFVSLLRRLVPDRNLRIWYVCLVVIAANAGGAWSPIGDVTTTMLWIGKKVTTEKLIFSLFIPSVLCLLVPLAVMYFSKNMQGEITPASGRDFKEKIKDEGLLSSKVMLAVGVGSLLFVPIFKTLTHLPPYMGMLLGLCVTWLVSEFIHPEENFDESKKKSYSAHHALSRIEMSSILFFLGILMAIAALETVAVVATDGSALGLLAHSANLMDAAIPNQNIVIMLIGALSAIIDNVPLVAASMAMYTDPIDSDLWHFIAFAAGTGGSMLIIGSAAGVAAMGMEKIDFMWYLKKVSWLALIGYLAGCGAFLLFFG